LAKSFSARVGKGDFDVCLARSKADEVLYTVGTLGILGLTAYAVQAKERIK